MELLLDNLGWYQFERLCQVIIKAEFDKLAASWDERGDWGVDSLATTQVRLNNGSALPPKTIFQCKFVERASSLQDYGRANLLHSFRAEVDRIQGRLNNSRTHALWSTINSYVLMTNAQLTAAAYSHMEETLRSILADCQLHVIARKDITDLLIINPAIRHSFPQLLGNADLISLIRAFGITEVENRTKQFLRNAEILSKSFVATAAYHDALALLAEHSFVVLTGPPEMGKTTIASLIALLYVTYEYQVFECASPVEVWKSYNPDQKQLFYSDDAFGRSDFDPSKARAWEMELPRLLSAMGRHHLFIWTSRKVQLALAIRNMDLAEYSHTFPDLSTIIVDASYLSEAERIQILYRHAKAHLQSDLERQFIKLNAERIIKHAKFSPLRIARLMESLMHEDNLEQLVSNSAAAVRWVNNNIGTYNDRLVKSIAALDDEHQDLLLAVLDASQSTSTLESVEQAFDMLTSHKSKKTFKENLYDLTEHFLQVESPR